MPLTADRPKGMVALAGVPLLARQIAVLRAAGIADITLVGGYRADQLQELGQPVILNAEYETTNMVTSLMCARTVLSGDVDVVVGYGDIVYEPAVLQALMRPDGDLIVTADRGWRALWDARMDDPAADVESFRVNADGTLAELGRKPRSLDDVQGQYIGLIRVPAGQQRRLLDTYDSLDPLAWNDGQSLDRMFMTSFIQHCVDEGWRVVPAWIDGGWVEVDTPQDLARYHAMSRDGTLDRICRLRWTPDTEPLRAIQRAALESQPQTAASTSELVAFLRAASAASVLSHSDLAMLDRLARKVEISGSVDGPPCVADALLATFLLAFAQTRDYRHLNTVLKAIGGTLRVPLPTAHDAIDGWCEAALSA